MFGYESHRDQAHRFVSHQRHIVPPLEVAEPEFRLGDPEGVFHVPASERNPDHFLDISICGSVGQEELLLAGLVVARPDQPVTLLRPPLLAVQPDSRRLDPPDLILHRLPVKTHHLPLLGSKEAPGADHVFGLPGLDCPLWPLSGSRNRQARETARHFTSEQLVALIQAKDELGNGTITFVKGQCVENDPVGVGPIELLQGDLPLGAVDDLVGDASSDQSLGRKRSVSIKVL